MILVLLIILMILIFNNNNEQFTDSNLKIINEVSVPKSKCFYNNNEMFIGKKYIQKLSDNKFYTTCEYELDKNNQCNAPCLLVDSKCNTTSDPISFKVDKNNNQKCRTESKLI